MKITAVETYALNIPLKPERRMITALGEHIDSPYVLVRIETDSAVDGAGEATVMPRWSGETQWGCQGVIDRIFRPLLIGVDPHDLIDIDRRMDKACQLNWFAKSAIEMACWDIVGKAAKKPVYELLGGPHRPLAVKCRFSMGAYDIGRAQRRAAELVAEGFDYIKVKVGGEAQEDIARVKAVRDVIGPDKKLMIDANCGWNVDTAVYAVNTMQDLGLNLALVEQPTPDGDYAALARVRRETTPPVMADDMCFDMVHARELIRNEACDVISLYPGKNGGIRKAKEIAEFAAEHGVACGIGSNLEWDVGTAAMMHLVIGVANMQVERFPGDILGPEYHELRIAKNPISIKGPVVTITDRPGLGIDVDWDLVRRMSADGRH
jgi:L-alanine-DL-glutamate epimerase-like enolase superfamily enzyme